MGSYGLVPPSAPKKYNLPPPVEQVATSDTLGSFLQQYPFSTLILLKRIGTGVACIVTGGLFGLIPYFVGTSGIHNLGDMIITGVLILLTLSLLIGGFWLIIASLLTVTVTRQRIYLFQKGMVIFKAGRASSYPWTEVKAVLQEVTHHYKQKAPSSSSTTYEGTEYRYKLQLRDGRTLRLNNTTENIKELGEKITQRVEDILWPDAQAELKAGHIVSFGTMGLSEEGITKWLGGKTQEMLPWSSVGEFGIKDGSLTIRKGKAYWTSCSLATLPNAHLFLTLSNQMLARHGTSVSSKPGDAIYRQLRKEERPY